MKTSKMQTASFTRNSSTSTTTKRGSGTRLLGYIHGVFDGTSADELTVKFQNLDHPPVILEDSESR